MRSDCSNNAAWRRSLRRTRRGSVSVFRRKRPREKLVRAEGVEPTQPCGQRIFLPLRLSPPGCGCFAAFATGLRSGLSLHRPPESPRLRCCPSSLYTFPAGCSGLGSGLPLQGSPNLSSSASPVSRRALKFCLSPPRLPFRHAWPFRYITDFGPSLFAPCSRPWARLY